MIIMKWFFVLNDFAPRFEEYAQMTKVAVETAQTKTKLEPYLIYEGKENELTKWLKKRGVKIIFHRTPHYEKLKIQKPENAFKIGAGAFLKVEIPQVLKIYQMEDEYVLFTDCDVMFTGDVVEYCRQIKCEYFAAAPENDPNNWSYVNTGVMCINVPNMLKVYDEFNEFIDKNISQFYSQAFDQGAINQFFKGKWDRLDVAMNWKAYWPSNPDAKIIHFHGPKPCQADFIKGKVGVKQQILALANKNFWEYTAKWQEVYTKLTFNQEEEQPPMRLSRLQNIQAEMDDYKSKLQQIKTKLKELSIPGVQQS